MVGIQMAQFTNERAKNVSRMERTQEKLYIGIFFQKGWMSVTISLTGLGNKLKLLNLDY